jgi:hypothetical protein
MHILALSLLVGCSPQDTGLSNGPDDQELATGTGKMELDVTEIVISDIMLGYSKSAQFTVTSTGDANLQIYEIRIVADESDVFFFEEVEDIEFAPGQGDTFTVVADLDVAAAADGSLRLRTSDPDNATVTLPLHAYPEGYVPPEDTGDTADTGGDSGGGS